MPPKVKYYGVPFEAGDDTLVVPPLSARQLRELTPVIKAHDAIALSTSAAAEDALDRLNEKSALRVQIVHAALTRNYPEILLGRVEEDFDLDTLPRAFAAAIGVGQTARVRVGETKPAEPLPAPAPSTGSTATTGISSTGA